MEMPVQVCNRASGCFFPPCKAASSPCADVVGSRTEGTADRRRTYALLPTTTQSLCADRAVLSELRTDRGIGVSCGRGIACPAVQGPTPRTTTITEWCGTNPPANLVNPLFNAVQMLDGTCATRGTIRTALHSNALNGLPIVTIGIAIPNSPPRADGDGHTSAGPGHDDTAITTAAPDCVSVCSAGCRQAERRAPRATFADCDGSIARRLSSHLSATGQQADNCSRGNPQYTLPISCHLKFPFCESFQELAMLVGWRSPGVTRGGLSFAAPPPRLRSLRSLG
jgi:hypothetical protein